MFGDGVCRLIVELVSALYPFQVRLGIVVGSALSSWSCPPLERLKGLLEICSSVVFLCLCGLICIHAAILAASVDCTCALWIIANFDVVMMSVEHLNPSPAIFLMI